MSYIARALSKQGRAPSGPIAPAPGARPAVAPAPEAARDLIARQMSPAVLAGALTGRRRPAKAAFGSPVGVFRWLALLGLTGLAGVGLGFIVRLSGPRPGPPAEQVRPMAARSGGSGEQLPAGSGSRTPETTVTLARPGVPPTAEPSALTEATAPNPTTGFVRLPESLELPPPPEVPYEEPVRPPSRFAPLLGRGGTAEPPSPAEVLETFDLQGIIWSDRGRAAMINGVIVEEGSPVGEARVRKIDRRSVTIELRGQTYELRH